MRLALPVDVFDKIPYSYSLVPVVLLCATAFAVSKRRRDSRLPLPPGPPSEPGLGHLRVMPMEFEWKTFAEWGKKFGDLLYVSIMGKSIIILNSAEAARDLLDKRAANYSDRPRMILHGDLYGTSMLMPFLSYGERFRAQRRLMQQHFNSHAITEFRPIQTVEMNTFLKNLLATPEKFTHHVYRFTAGTLLMATYGHEVKSENDIITVLAVDAATRFIDGGTPGATIVDFFPILRYIPAWFPGATFQKKAQMAHKAHSDVRDVPYNEVKERRASGTAVPSLMSRMMDTYETKYWGDEDFETNMKHVAGVIYAAGVETSEVVLRTFLLMMTHHPEIVARAQAEIDEIVGNDRLPTFDDRPNLPYIECILKEVYRTNPPLPIGVAHQSMVEDTYKQRRIPSGSMVIPNIWSMMRDERHFPEPHRFNPDRFLSKVLHEFEMQSETSKISLGLNSTRPDDPSSLTFGFGRRACPGRFFADASAWLAIANILAVFDIRAPVDPETGARKPPPVEFTPGFASKPKSFKCDILPRSERHIALINQDAETL